MYTVQSQYDANESFDLDASDEEAAALNALESIGWRVCELDFAEADADDEGAADYTIMSSNDGNDTFEVRAKSLHDAALEALDALGWNVSVRRGGETTPEADPSLGKDPGLVNAP